MKRVLLTCARIPSALFLARALHRAGAEVHVTDPFPVHICTASNAVTACHKTSSPTKDKAAYKKEILDIITRHKIDIVIPVFEDSIFLAEFLDEITNKCDILLSNFDLLMSLHNKHDFIQLANSLGLPTPATFKYDFPADDFEFIKTNKYIVKRIYSRSGAAVKVFEAGESISESLQPNGEHVIQEFIDGHMICTCSYVYNGKLTLHTAYKQLILTPNGTAAICFEAIEDTRIRDSVESFVSKIGYTGWISFDIIQKPNGNFYYIECNPRTSLGISLFNPQILAKTLLGTRSDDSMSTAITYGNKAQITLVSIECVLRRLFKGKLTLAEIKHLIRAKDLIFDKADLFPYLYQFVCYFHVKYRAIKCKTSFLYAGTHDLEWN